MPWGKLTKLLGAEEKKETLEQREAPCHQVILMILLVCGKSSRMIELDQLSPETEVLVCKEVQAAAVRERLNSPDARSVHLGW